MALITADLDTEALVKKSFDEIADIISELVCRWNTEMTYCNFGSKKKKEEENLRNCQDFVEELMNSLGLKLKDEGALNKFLKKMKKSGKCELIFKPNKEYKEAFKLRLKEYKFDTHHELDIFVNKLIERNEIAFHIDFKDCKSLLKSFDRAFWLRHLKNPKDDRFKPRSIGPKAACPFDDPRETKSFICK
jgi:hypothetical protein